MFYSQHQTVVVEADGKLLYPTRTLNRNMYFAYNRSIIYKVVSVPENTRRHPRHTHQLQPEKTTRCLIRFLSAMVSICFAMNFKSRSPCISDKRALGILLLTYWLFVHHWAYVSKSMLLLITTDLGAWFCLETSSSILLSQNPVPFLCDPHL